VYERSAELRYQGQTWEIEVDAADPVDLPALVAAFLDAGFNVRELADDTLSCACTVRDWARALEAVRGDLARRHGEAAVRAFLLYLWCSHHFLATNRTQAYHLVASREPGGLGG
jgi:cyclopropane fatty-acyl-phospholipid synthase-like methyltransferase